MKISERLVVIETELKYIKKLMYVMVVAVLGTTGFQII